MEADKNPRAFFPYRLTPPLTKSSLKGIPLLTIWGILGAFILGLSLFLHTNRGGSGTDKNNPIFSLTGRRQNDSTPNKKNHKKNSFYFFWNNRSFILKPCLVLMKPSPSIARECFREQIRRTKDKLGKDSGKALPIHLLADLAATG